MKFIMKKIGLLFIAIIFISMFFSDRAYAVSISLELSGDGIQNANGIYLCTKKIPVGGTLNVKAEVVTSNDIYVEGMPTGEIGREDVTSKCEWKSSDENVAKVQNGVISGISEGIAEITVTYDNETYDFEISVGEEVEIGFGENIYITQKDNIKTILKRGTIQLDIEGVETLSNIKNEDVTWTSSNEKIATVDKKGWVTGTGVGKVTIKAEYTLSEKTYEDTYEIDVIEESKKDILLGYDLFTNKSQLKMDTGASDKIEITAEMKEGFVGIALYQEETDYYDVEWKIEDETIAKCVPEKGITNNIYGATQVVGRATIQGVKSGTTKLLIKVKVSADKIEEFEIPITINEVGKDNGKEDKKEDNTVADKKLANTGENNFIIVLIIGISIMSLAYLGIKLKNKF